MDSWNPEGPLDLQYGTVFHVGATLLKEWIEFVPRAVASGNWRAGARTACSGRRRPPDSYTSFGEHPADCLLARSLRFRKFKLEEFVKNKIGSEERSL